MLWRLNNLNGTQSMCSSVSFEQNEQGSFEQGLSHFRYDFLNFWMAVTAPKSKLLKIQASEKYHILQSKYFNICTQIHFRFKFVLFITTYYHWFMVLFWSINNKSLSSLHFRMWNFILPDTFLLVLKLKHLHLTHWFYFLYLLKSSPFLNTVFLMIFKDIDYLCFDINNKNNKFNQSPIIF